MKMPSSLLLALLPILSRSLPLWGATDAPVPLRVYPWSESSEFIRVGKDLLDRVTLLSVTITNSNSMQFVLTPEFIVTLSLSPQEIERVNTAVSNALHAYRTVRSSRFEPLYDGGAFDRARSEVPYPSGSFSFRVKPFEGEAAAIGQQLRSDVLAALGPQRAEHFWRGGRYLEGELQTTNHSRIVGQTHSFSLLTASPGPLVDLKVSTSGGHHGRPYGAALDAYAPSQLKPILERWRAWIAERPPGSYPWTVAPEEQTVVYPPDRPSPLKWDEAAEYIDLPKSAMRALRVLGLTEDEELSPEAITVLGLAPGEVTAVNNLYREMEERVEQLERANLVLTDSKQPTFILRAFPEKAAALKQEWLTRLGDLLGASRALFLDHLVRQPVAWDMLANMRSIDRRERWIEMGPRWFDLGMFEISIHSRKVTLADGREFREFRYKSDRPESVSISGPQLKIPDRFRHLLTPEILRDPGTFWLQP